MPDAAGVLLSCVESEPHEHQVVLRRYIPGNIVIEMMSLNHIEILSGVQYVLGIGKFSSYAKCA